MDKALKYEDVCLIPEYSECNSRSECSTFTVFGRQQFRLPVVPANMKSVISLELAEWMSRNNHFYIMHRFEVDMLKFIQDTQDWKCISISVGVREDDFGLLVKAHSLKLKIHYIL